MRTKPGPLKTTEYIAENTAEPSKEPTKQNAIDTRCLSRPDGPTLAAFAKAATKFFVLFYTLYFLASVITDHHSYRFNVGFEFEKLIPFEPVFAVVYLSVSPILCLSLFVIRQPAHFDTLARILSQQTMIGFTVFVVFPVQNNFPPISATELPPLFRLADAINLSHNELPSLHFCLAATVARVYSDHCTRLVGRLFHLWAFAIALSTLLLHEHNLLDLAAGYLLAHWGYHRWRRATRTG